MKTCQVCGYVAGDVAPTCPNCGEASWAPRRPVPGMKGAVLILDEQAPKATPEPAELTDAELEALTAPTHTQKKGKR